MSIKNISPNYWFIRVRARNNGTVIGKKKYFTGTRIEAKAAELDLAKEIGAEKKDNPVTSFTPSASKLPLFGDIVKFWVERTTAKITFKHFVDRLISDLGNVRNEEMAERFGDFIDALRKQRQREWIGERQRLLNIERVKQGKKPIKRELGDILKPRTRNFYLDVANRAYNFAIGRGKIKENPLKLFKKEPEEPRDRVLSEKEKEEIFKVLRKRESPLYWPFYFSCMNPIRRGDMKALTKDSLSYNRFNPLKSYIHFLPQKTGRYKPAKAHLICLDKPLLDYFKSVPADCPLLFPRFDAKGMWHPLGCFKREWTAVRKAAKIKGFCWHDLKHCAVTWMLDNGFSELDLKNLGIQYDARMIKVYYHKDAFKAMGPWEKIVSAGKVVAPECGPLAHKMAESA